MVAWAWQQPVDDSTRKLVLVKLADSANDEGVCSPTQDRLAVECGVSERTVRRHLKRLGDDGLIVATSRRCDEVGRRRRENSYRLVHRTPVTTGHPCPPDTHVRSQEPLLARASEQVVSPKPKGQDLNRKNLRPPPGDELALVDETGGPLEKVVGTNVLVGEFVDEARRRGVDPPKMVNATMGRAVKALLAEGRTADEIRAGMNRMLDRAVVQPTMLPQFVVEAALPRRRASSPEHMTPEEMLADAARDRRREEEER